MKVSILTVTICPATIKVIKYFKDRNFKIDSVIIENNFRKKYSASEVQYRQKHDKFNRMTKKYPLIRRVARILWDKMPLSLRKFVQQKIYYIPLLNKFSVRRTCEKLGIEVIEVAKHSSLETKRIIMEQGIDYLLFVNSNWLLKEPIISLDNTKIINAHSGWLPKHKGLDSIPWALKSNDKVGITTHFINAGIDSGPILAFYEANIEKCNSFNMVKQRVGDLQPMAFYDTLVKLEKKEIEPIVQDDKYKPHAPMTFEELWELEQKLKNSFINEGS